METETMLPRRITMHRTLAHIMPFVLLLLLVSCGGGGDGSRPASVPFDAVISGTVFDGAVRDGTVNIYDWTTGAKGNLIGSVVTDSQGKFSLTRQTLSTEVLFEVISGFYFEEATNSLIQLDGDQGLTLRAVEVLVPGAPSTIQVTGITTAATGLAEFLVGQGVTAQNAVIAANQVISDWMGFDIVTVEPLDVVDPANASSTLTQRHKYGFVSAGVSELTKRADLDAFRTPHTKWTSIAFYNLMYRDIRADGLFNGLAAGGSPLRLDNTDLSRDFYRVILAERLMQFVLGASNNTTLDFDTVLPFASQLNLHTGEIFGGVPPAADIRNATTRIVNFLPPDGVTISGNYTANAKLTDSFGIKLTEYLIDGNFLASPGSNENPVYTIQTGNFANGAHTITIEVTNILDNKSSVTHNITIQN
jgi:hypothetical protein